MDAMNAHLHPSIDLLRAAEPVSLHERIRRGLRGTCHNRIMNIVTVLLVNVMIATATTQVVGPDASEQRIVLLMPLIGALLIMSGAFLLNPDKSTLRVTAGRVLFGLLFGVGGPSALHSLLGYWDMQGLLSLMLTDGMLLFEGATAAFVTYWLSWPFTRRFYESSDDMALFEVTRIRKLQGSERDEKVDEQ